MKNNPLILRSKFLLDKYSESFEYLENSKEIKTDDDLIFLKVAINNILIEIIDCENKELNNQVLKDLFIKVILLSSPVFFDFLYGKNSSNKIFVQEYLNYKYFSDARSWYKFVRNSVVHGYRFDQNNLIEKIFRIDYRNSLTISFELKENTELKFSEFQENYFYMRNLKTLTNNQILWNSNFLTSNYDYEKGEIVIFQVDYNGFITFIVDQLEIYYKYLRKITDRYIDIHKNFWWNYYHQYLKMIYSLKREDCLQKQVLLEHLTLYNAFTNIDQNYVYDIVFFLLSLKEYSCFLTSDDLQTIADNTINDKYNWIINESLLINQFSKIKIKYEYLIFYKDPVINNKVRNFLIKNELLSVEFISKKEKENEINLYLVYLLKFLRYKNLI